MPLLRAGYQVRVHQKIKEGEKERVQVFEGLIVSVSSGHGSQKTFTVRKVVQGIGVEKIFPINSPLIAKLEIKKTLKVRRAKLNFMRGTIALKRLSGKLGLLDKDEEHKKKKGLHEEEEEVKAEAAAPAETSQESEAPKEEVKEEVKAEAPQEEKAEVKEEKKEEEKAEEAPKEEKKEEEKAEETPKEEKKEE